MINSQVAKAKWDFVVLLKDSYQIFRLNATGAVLKCVFALGIHRFGPI